MSRQRTTVEAALGVVAGALLAGGGLLAGGLAAEDDSAPTTLAQVVEATPSPEVRQPIVAPNETVLGPTVLVPTGLDVTGTELSFTYDLVDRVPPPASDPRFATDEVPIVAPELWTLRLEDGRTFEGETANVRARRAVFEVPEGFDVSDVDSITLERWRMRLPLRFEVDLAHNDTEERQLDEGVVVAMRQVLEQANNTLVQVTLETSHDLFSGTSGGFGQAFEAAPLISGAGQGWVQVGPIEHGVQLTHEGGDLADPVGIIVVSKEWIAFEEPIVVELGTIAE